ncbi:MAG TPA: DUF2236 domain-containing protein [Candidatus Corynebacterium avicola]|uniref:DUF2236 domain-containing protein n=1 Tax=Candidatus Corynebacterium avicola TaxID=2838527 RepID=A0A9D1UKN4_9CORY|nr:DUF2236 domain-containing protein [Candidatus Corynebacterium avicola]
MGCPFHGDASELDEVLAGNAPAPDAAAPATEAEAATTATATETAAASNDAAPAAAETTAPAATRAKKNASAARIRESVQSKRFKRGDKDDRIVRKDEGFFGPGSMTWKIWGFPAFSLMGFARSVTIEHLDPDLVASVDASGQVYKRTPVRYDRTMEYFSALMFADSQTITRMADILMKVHDRSYGENPVTGNNFEANKPSSQLWIMVTAWHSMLYCYEKFGPGKLSRDEENEYWQEMKRACELQPINLDDVPTTRGEVQKFFDDWREKLSASEAAIRNTDHILDGVETIEPDFPKWFIALIRPLFRWGTIATYPRWMRPMLGVKQSRLMDQLMFWTWKPIFAFFLKFPKVHMEIVKRASPRAVRYFEAPLLGVPAESPKIMKPEVARRMYGNPKSPLEQREELLAKRNEGIGQKSYNHNHTDQILEFRSADSVETTKDAIDSTNELVEDKSKAS